MGLTIEKKSHHLYKIINKVSVCPDGEKIDTDAEGIILCAPDLVWGRVDFLHSS